MISVISQALAQFTETAWDAQLTFPNLSDLVGTGRWEYTGWPRKNATTLIVNYKNIFDETELFFILFGRTFIFQQNDTMIINFG